MKAIRTWILVSDGRRARVLEHSTATAGLILVEGEVFENGLLASSVLQADPPARDYNSDGNTRHSPKPIAGPDWHPHWQLRQIFAHRLAECLAERHARKSFDRLVLMAPPGVLADLREAMSPTLSRLVIGDIPEDLTHLDDHAIAVHFHDVLLS